MTNFLRVHETSSEKCLYALVIRLVGFVTRVENLVYATWIDHVTGLLRK